MKKILILLICAAALFTTGCVSSSTMMKLSDDECMIVMRAGTYKDNPGAQSGRNYYLHVKEIDQMLRIPSTEDRYIYFKIYNDKTKIDKLIGKIKSGWSGPSFTDELDMKLPYIPGEVVILEKRLALELKKVGSSSYRSNVEFYNMSKEEVDLLLIEIKNNPDFESWF